MLEREGVDYQYREYTEEPLSPAELRQVLEALGVGPQEVLRTRDPAYRKLGLDGREKDDELLRLMAAYPTLLQRPIGWRGEQAVIGRPVERLLEL